MPFMEFSDGDPIKGSTITTLVTRTQFLATKCQTVQNIAPRNDWSESDRSIFSEDQICSGQGFDLIIGAIRHHFRLYLEAEPEVQAEAALYHTVRVPKATFVEYKSRIRNTLRELESGFKELLPHKLKCFIIKQLAKLTHDQTKHLHFHIPTRGLEADKMADALNRLDQTDALVEQILGDRAKFEQTANGGHAHSNSHAHTYPMEAEISRHQSRTTTITTKHRRRRRVINWIGILKELMMTVIPWGRKRVPLWYEDETNSVSSWAQGYREVRKNLRDSITGRGY